jgi:osmotically-inducible protein OsmY
MQKKLAAVAVLFAFFTVACGSINRVIPTDEAMKADVKGKIAEVYPTKATDIGVTVNSGVVTLSGTVDTATQRTAIENAANSVHGVKSVIDNITLKQ